MGNGNTKAKGLVAAVIANVRLSEMMGKSTYDRKKRDTWKQLLEQAPKTVQEKRAKLSQSKPGKDNDALDKILVGEIPQSCRGFNSREVRVFVSSTFSDMKSERDVFMEDVYPYLRELCRRLGYEFTAGDLRWGVRDEMTDEHQAVDICLSEIELCRRESVGPFLVCILGSKYGFRPIPARIRKNVFEVLLTSVKSHSGDHQDGDYNLLHNWYKLDTNSNPPVYLLQSISTHYPWAYRLHATKAKDEIKVNAERKAWFEEFLRMKKALQKAASEIDFTMFKDTNISEDNFRFSVTHFELIAAFQDRNGNIEDSRIADRVFILTRSYKTNTESGTAVELSKAFIDRDNNGAVDCDAQDLLRKMKDMCEKTVPPKDIYKYSVTYDVTDDGHIDIKSNMEGMGKMCDVICQFLTDAIIEAVASNEVYEDSLHNEVLNNLLFCGERATSFFGREPILHKINTYLKLHNGSKPLVIHGVSGSGKTSIIAKAFLLSTEDWKGVDEGRPVHIIRFLGTTPNSSSVRVLLSSLCSQLCTVLDVGSTPVPEDFERLVTTFHSLLKKATPERPVDSLDQLSDQDDGRALRWLPVSLPKNVHVIVSTLTTVGGCLAALKTKMKPETFMDCYVEVPTLDEKDVEGILDMRLHNANRFLTSRQRQAVLEAPGKPTALYVKLACDTALSWQSYTPENELQLKSTATEMIEHLFKRLENIHGKAVVCHALGFITASRTGLSRSELEDILSCDDLMLDDQVFKYHVPPVRRLPPLLWTRLRNDLGPYLVEVAADDHVVYKWYHRLFQEAARGYFLSDKPFADMIRVELANYFLGRWAVFPKPYNQISGARKSAYRWVAEQPLMWSRPETSAGDDVTNDTNMVKYNLRKLSEMPYQLTRAEMWNEFVENVCQINWIEAKCRTGRAFELTAELSEAFLKCDTDKTAELEDFYSFIRANAQLLSQFPGLVVQQALNERDSSHCAAKAQEYLSQNVRSLDLPCWSDMTKSQVRKPDIVTYKHPTPVTKCVFSKKCKYLATYGEDGVLRVFMVASGSVVMTTTCSCQVIEFPRDDDATWVAVADTHSIVRYAIGRAGTPEGAVLQKILVDVAIDENSDIIINQKCKQWEISLATCHGKIRCFSTSLKSNGVPVYKEEFPRRPKVVKFSPNGKQLAFGQDNVYLWNYKSMKDPQALVTGKKISTMESATLVFNAAGSKLGAVLSNGTYIWWTSSGKVFKSLAITCLGSEFVMLSPDLDYVAMPSDRDPNDLSVFCMAPKPFDKSPVWDTLSGHSAPITSCAIGTRPHGRPLVATSSQDHTVQLWDTKHMPTPQVANLPDHSSDVMCCALSHDCTMAVTRTSTETWVWQVTSPVRRLYQLEMPQESKRSNVRVVCFSDDDQFIAAPVPSGVNVWHLKSGFDVHGVDTSIIKGCHRTLTLLDVNHLFTMFATDGLYTCFVPENEQHTLRLCLSINSHTLNTWAKHEKGDEPISLDDYQPFEQRFNVKSSEMIIAASMTSSCDKLAAIVHGSSPTSSVDLILWDMPDRGDKRTSLTSHPRATHVVSFTSQYLLLLTQEKTEHENNREKPKLSNHGSDRSESGGLVRVLDKNARVLHNFQVSGTFSQLFGSPNLDNDETKVSDVVLIGGIHDGAVRTMQVESGKVFGEFAARNADISSFDIGKNSSSVVLGCSNGRVVVLSRFHTQ